MLLHMSQFNNSFFKFAANFEIFCVWLPYLKGVYSAVKTQTSMQQVAPLIDKANLSGYFPSLCQTINYMTIVNELYLRSTVLYTTLLIYDANKPPGVYTVSEMANVLLLPLLHYKTKAPPCPVTVILVIYSED